MTFRLVALLNQREVGMKLPEKVGKLSTPMLVLFVVSKIILGIGLGILLAGCMPGAGWWMLIAGIILSAVPGIKILRTKDTTPA